MIQTVLVVMMVLLMVVEQLQVEQLAVLLSVIVVSKILPLMEVNAVIPHGLSLVFLVQI
jgi:hypothetical protein